MSFSGRELCPCLAGHCVFTGPKTVQTAPWRNYLWQSDIKYGIYIGGKPTYMVCFLDDCTRNIMHSEFYDTLDQSIVQDCFRKALLKHGAPDCVYFDYTYVLTIPKFCMAA